MTAAEKPDQGENDDLLEKANQAFAQSTTFLDNNYRKAWDNNLRLHQSKHQSGSKYYKEAYKYRTKFFRPKTRSAVRAKEAAAAAAFFSNPDVVSIEPRDPNDPFNKAGADLNRELVNFRLTETIPWFQICMGGVQDALVIGVVASYQHWAHETRKVKVKTHPVDPETGEVERDENGKLKVTEEWEEQIIKDEPVVELVPVENLRIHPAADWTDPINSSPYVIHMIPMYVMDVKARMRKKDPVSNESKWMHLTDGEIQSARKNTYDSTRQVREGDREEKLESANTQALSDYDIVWVHRVFMREEDGDKVFYTLGTEHRLSNPEPVEEVYWKGERPIVMGCSVIETHKIYSSSLVELGAPVQKELNENVNQRMDNVKLVLNKRYLVRRGAQVNLRSITRNVSGSVTLVNDIEKDIKDFDFKDVTGSAYQEQDRLNVDYDEMTGTFSTSTIQTNRKMNETVGGMGMLRGVGNNMTEYVLRTIAETWMEKVVKQVSLMEAKYESDKVVLALAAAKAEIAKKYGVNRITVGLLEMALSVRVNVGMGATDPLLKIQSFMLGVQTILRVIKEDQTRLLDIMEIAKEVFGRLGYKDGVRFFAQAMRDDPTQMQAAAVIKRLQEIVQGLQAELEDKVGEQEAKIYIEHLKEAGANKRKEAELETRIQEKVMDLMNPVSGETSPSGALL